MKKYLTLLGKAREQYEKVLQRKESKRKKYKRKK